MIRLHQIAGDDFLLLDAEQEVALALAAVDLLAPMTVVVRRGAQGATRYHLFTASMFQAFLAGVETSRTMAEVLDLTKNEPVPAAAAHSDAELAPPRCVVIDDGRVVGFEDASLPPLLSRRSGRSDELPVAVGLDLDFPLSVTLSMTAALVVTLARGLSTRSLEADLPAGTPLDIVVSAGSGFELDGTREGRLIVTEREEALPLCFMLRATTLGPGRIRVLCLHGGAAVGSFTLCPTVTAAASASSRDDTSRAWLSPSPPAQPDLSVMVFECELGGRRAIELRLSAADPTLDLNLRRFGPVPFTADPQIWFRRLFEDIGGLSLGTAAAKTVAAEQLARRGAHLFEEILPSDLRALLFSIRRRIHVVQVQSEEPWIPWELLRLHGQEGGRDVEGPHFGEGFAFLRWTPGLGRRPELRLRRLAVVAPPMSGLSFGREERDHLLSLSSAEREIVEVPATYLHVLEALASGSYDGFHFVAHGRAHVGDLDGAAIELSDGLELRAEMISGRIRNCGKTRPIVVLDACHSGRPALALTGVGGFAARFLGAGAAVFAAPLWSVDDRAALEFTKAFYGSLLGGATLGGAALAARLAVRAVDPVAWLAYAIFGDPFARLA